MWKSNFASNIISIPWKGALFNRLKPVWRPLFENCDEDTHDDERDDDDDCEDGNNPLYA